MNPHKEAMIAAAKKAGAYVLEQFGKDIEGERKKDNSVVTIADKEAERIILEELKQFNYDVIAEESGTKKNDNEYCWVIDPIDGTSNFSRNIPLFAISIGLMKNNTPIAGAIYLPCTDQLLYGDEDGAFLNEKQLTIPEPALQYLLIFDNNGKNKMAREKFAILEARISDSSPYYKPRYFGSACIELFYTITGKTDASIMYGLNAWDVAAGIAIAKALGMHVSTWKNEEWKEGELNTLICRPDMSEHLLQQLSTYLDESPQESL